MLEETVIVGERMVAAEGPFAMELRQRGLGGVFLRLAWSQGRPQIVSLQQAGHLGLAPGTLHRKSLADLGWTAAELFPMDTPQERYLRLGGKNLHLMCGLVSSGEDTLGWLGVSMERGRHEAWRAFMAAREQLAPTPPAETGLSATIVLCPKGGVELSCENAAIWLGRDGFQEALAGLVADLQSQGRRRYAGVLLGSSVRLKELRGHFQTRYLIRIEPYTLLPLPLLTQLTDAQLQVAIYAAAGATISEIARTLERSENTVRSHLKLAYARLEISSRLELAQLIEQVWPTFVR